MKRSRGESAAGNANNHQRDQRPRGELRPKNEHHAARGGVTALSKRRRAGCIFPPLPLLFRLLFGYGDLSFGSDDLLDVETQSLGHTGSVCGISLVEVLDLQFLDALRN